MSKEPWKPWWRSTAMPTMTERKASAMHAETLSPTPADDLLTAPIGKTSQPAADARSTVTNRSPVSRSKRSCATPALGCSCTIRSWPSDISGTAYEKSRYLHIKILQPDRGKSPSAKCSARGEIPLLLTCYSRQGLGIPLPCLLDDLCRKNRRRRGLIPVKPGEVIAQKLFVKAGLPLSRFVHIKRPET